MNDSVDEEQIATAESRAKRIRDREIADLGALMSTEQGRRFVHRLLGLAGIYHTSFVGDAAGTAFNEGRRSLGLRVLAEIEANFPDAMLEMIREAYRRQKNGEP